MKRTIMLRDLKPGQRVRIVSPFGIVRGEMTIDRVEGDVIHFMQPLPKDWQKEDRLMLLRDKPMAPYMQFHDPSRYALSPSPMASTTKPIGEPELAPRAQPEVEPAKRERWNCWFNTFWKSGK